MKLDKEHFWREFGSYLPDQLEYSLDDSQLSTSLSHKLHKQLYVKLSSQLHPWLNQRLLDRIWKASNEIK